VGRLLTTTALLTALVIPAAADQEYYEIRELAKKSGLKATQMAQWEAEAQGYASRVVDIGLCEDEITITDPVLQAKLTSKYRDNRRYQKAYYRGYLTPDVGLVTGKQVDETKRMTRCYMAVSHAPWLALRSKAKN
jgi:hypothetical protein